MQKIDSEKLNFSDTAVQHFNKVLDDRGKGIGIKIGVKKAGCSGYEYTFGFVDELNSDFIAKCVGCCPGSTKASFVPAILTIAHVSS